ncbi:MAG: insulinase family protein [Firmicutes bacterium]|nr:insulinase family protein [Bacillota bacterium]
MTWSKTVDEFLGEWQNGTGWYVYPTKRFKTVTIYAAWIRELEPSARARGALLPHVLRRGTRAWPTRVLMEQQLESLYGASFRADVGKLGDKQLLSFHITVVNGQFLPEHPDTVAAALDFLTEVLDHPQLVDGRFPDEVVDQEKELIKRQISALINDKGQYALSRLIELVADGQRFGLKKLGTPQEIDQVSGDLLVDFLNENRQESPFVFAVVGDVDPDRIQKHMAERWGRGDRRPLTTIQPYTGRHDRNTVVERQDVRQGKLNLAFRTNITAKDPQYPALVMYSGILGGFSHSKLFLNVREKASLAYYAYSRIDPAVALMIIGAGIEFDDYEAARRIIEEQVEAMRAGQFSPEEMAFTLKAYTNDVLSEEDNPGQLIGRQLEQLLIGGGLSGPQLIDALGRVTSAEIVEVAKQVELDTVYFLTSEGDERHGG